jgi:hypothetical protein
LIGVAVGGFVVHHFYAVGGKRVVAVKQFHDEVRRPFVGAESVFEEQATRAFG